MPNGFQNDEVLLRGCAVNDPRAWNEFIRRFSRLIYWSIRRTLDDSRFGSREDFVQEVFQDVFKKIFEKDSFSQLKETAHIKKFLVVLSTHLTLDRIKGLSRHEEKNRFIEEVSGAGLSMPIAQGPDEEVDKNEKSAILAEAMDSLAEKERACLEFSIHSQRTHLEIGLLMGLPQDTVSSIIRRAKDKIKERVTKKGYFE